MRTLLLAPGLLLALSVSGCDTVGIDDSTCTTCHDDPDEGGSTRGTVTVDPRQTYLFADEQDDVPQPIDAVAVPLSHLGLEPGDHACFEARGDYYYSSEDYSARERGGPLVTAVFSSSGALRDVTARYRVEGAIDAGDDVQTETTWLGDAPTDIDEDFDATDACVTVPAGASYLFFSPVDRLVRDNADAMVDDEPFRVDVTH